MKQNERSARCPGIPNLYLKSCLCLSLRAQQCECLTWGRLGPKFNCLRHWFTWANLSQSSVGNISDCFDLLRVWNVAEMKNTNVVFDDLMISLKLNLCKLKFHCNCQMCEIQWNKYKNEFTVISAKPKENPVSSRHNDFMNCHSKMKMQVYYQRCQDCRPHYNSPVDDGDGSAQVFWTQVEFKPFELSTSGYPPKI